MVDHDSSLVKAEIDAVSTIIIKCNAVLSNISLFTDVVYTSLLYNINERKYLLSDEIRNVLDGGGVSYNLKVG